MADLFEAKGATSFGRHYAQGVAPDGLDHIQDKDPLSARFVSPCRTATDLTRYLIATQVGRYGHSIEQQERILTRHAKLLLEHWSVEILARAVAYTAQVSLYPYSFKLVEKIVPELIQRCIYLTESQIQAAPKIGSSGTESSKKCAK